MRDAIRVVVVDDHPLFREGVARSLSEIRGFEVVGEGSSGDDAVRLVAEQSPEILLLDISMPGGGLSAVEAIIRSYPAQKVVMLTVSEASEDVLRAISCGARGYVLKGVGARNLAEILASVATGQRYVSPTLSAQLLSNLSGGGAQSRTAQIEELTARERQVIELVAAGLSNKRIGMKLNLHEKTVKHHMTRILAKLAVQNRTEAAMAFRDAADAGARRNA
jgi:two-component system nitrate/nitrite response regulator NarL